VDIALIVDRVRRGLRVAHNQGPGSWNPPPKILPAVVSRRKGGTDGQSSTPNFDRIVASRPAQRRPATFLVGRPIPDRNVRGHDTIVTVLKSAEQFEDDKLSGWLTAMLQGTSGTSAVAPMSVFPCRCHRWERRPAARVHFQYLEKTTTSTIDKCHVPQKTTSTHPLGSVIERPNKLPTDPKFIICCRYQDLWSGRFAGS
jgi:hypothetical protein